MTELTESNPEGRKSFTKLSQLGQTYQYDDAIVVPAQYYARWSGEHIESVGEAVDHLYNRGRIDSMQHFFKLDDKAAKTFVTLNKCEIDLQDVENGLILLTRQAVKSLESYFEEGKVISKNGLIDGRPMSFSEIYGSKLSSRERMILLGEWCQQQADASKERQQKYDSRSFFD